MTSVFIGLATLLLAAGIPSARASYIVSTQAQTATLPQPSGPFVLADASYNSSVVGAFFSTNLSGIPGATANVSGSTGTSGTLTGSIDTASTSDPATSSGTQTGSAFAAADLSTGTLKASTTTNGNFDTSSASASYSDTLHFTVAGANPSTITYLPVTLSLDGLMTAANPGQDTVALRRTFTATGPKLWGRQFWRQPPFQAASASVKHKVEP